MGRRFEEELRLLDSTYHWALTIPTEGVRSFVESSLSLPLITVGSGGSFSAAHFASLLHGGLGCVSKSVTPLGCLGMHRELRNGSALIISARGRNPDVITALKHAAESEPRQLHVICFRQDSELRQASNEYRYVQFDEFELPSGRDGFLATNSLLASSILLCRAYSEVAGRRTGLSSGIGLNQAELERLKKSLHRIVEKRYLVVLYGGWASVAATDLESKLTEGGLCSVQLADYRNFAHGRHYWLARHGSETGIVCIASRDELVLARKTLGIVPSKIPTALVSSESVGPASAIELLIKSYYVVSSFGAYSRVDPGRPKVPDFGRRIYSMKIPLMPKVRRTVGMGDQALAIVRKTNLDFMGQLSEKDQRRWLKAYRVYQSRMSAARFGAVVFDYDGTLCDPCERYSPLSPNISRWLRKLVKTGIIVGIASGRGKSVRVALGEAIPEIYRDRVLVGYYNGADIAPLSDSSHPDVGSRIDSGLASVIQALKRNVTVFESITVETRPLMSKIEPRNHIFWNHAKEFIFETIAREGTPVKVFESDHSIDIVPERVTKLAIVEACGRMAVDNGEPSSTLCIGDRGRWPGNDFELLSTPYSLSVDTVSSDPATCWNIGMAGHRGVQATLDYLDWLGAEGRFGNETRKEGGVCQ